MKRSSIVFVVFLAAALMASPAAGQTQITTGVIQGVVQDETGAVMPGATVTVRNLETNFEQTAETDLDGRFVFLQLRSGPYTLRVSKQGFSTLIQERMSLTVGQTIPLTMTMRVSPVAEEIIVTGSPTVDIVKTESSSTLNELSVDNTPVLGRKFGDLFTLTPGVAIVSSPDGDQVTFAGQRGTSNNISLDGGDYNNGFFGEQSGGQRPATDITLEAVKEFGKSLGKTIIVAPDTPGFIVNRQLAPFQLTAIRMLEAGLATKEDIDTGVTHGLNMPIGMLALADLVGLDTLLNVANGFYEQTKDPIFAPPTLLQKMVAAGWLGRKSGKGFYEYK